MKRTNAVLVKALMALGAAALMTGTAVPAHAESVPSIAFATQSITTAYGGEWLVEVNLTAPEGYGVVDATWGTVDIQLDDVPGLYSAGLPILRGGTVYFSRPADAPLLSAGEHRATAVFRPQMGGLVETQTATPLVITVTPLALAPNLEILQVPGDEASPYAQLGLAGEYVDALGTPPGSWALTVTRDGAPVLEDEILVLPGEGPVSVSLAEYVRPGTTLDVAAVFTADAAVAGGITAGEAAAQQVVTPRLTPVEWLTRPVAVPWWALGVGLALLLGAVVAAIIVVVRTRRRPSADVEAEPEEEPALASAGGAP